MRKCELLQGGHITNSTLMSPRAVLNVLRNAVCPSVSQTLHIL